MSLDCLNETRRFGNATLRSVEENQSSIGWFIGSCVLSTSLMANGWLLAVSWGTTYIDGIFKYPVCYLAFCDAWLAFVRIAQTTLHLFADPSTYLHYCAVPYALLAGAANAMLCALIPIPLQRCLMFIDVPWLSDHAERPRSILVFCAVMLFLSVVPPVGSILAPSSRCLNEVLCPQLPINGLFFLLTRLPPALSYIAAVAMVSLFVSKVKKMHSSAQQLAAAAKVTTSSEQNLNRDVLAMAVMQTINPILLSAPLMIIVAGRLFGITPYPALILITAGAFQLNPLMDALSTIYYIKPYRRLALKTAKQIRQIISKPNAATQTPAVIVTVAAAGTAKPNNDWRVTIGSLTQPQPLPPIEHKMDRI